MKPAVEWLNVVAETVARSMFAGRSPPGIEVEKIIARIQADALRHAADVMERESSKGPDWVRSTLIHQANKLEML